MNKSTLFGLFFLVSSVLLYPQNSSPDIDIRIQDRDDYTRHPRLEEEDLKEGETPVFSQGLEIITDIEYVKVYISENEAGRTPYEDKDISIGYYRIRLEKPGYEDITIWANVRKGERTTVEVRYKAAEEELAGPVEKERKIRKGPVYAALNPEDPFFYVRILYSQELFRDNNYDLILTDAENTPLITLSPQSSLNQEQVYYWNGRDIDGNSSPDGTYAVYAVSDFTQNASFAVDRRFSRKAASSFSGFTGLSLVPAAQPLFRGSFQFGSVFSSDFSLSNAGDSANLPFSFFLRFSLVPGWEAAFQGEVSMHPEKDVPLIKVNTSQKVLLTGSGPFLFSVNGRFSYRADINDFSELAYNEMVRDPAGASLAFPVQFKVNLWDFYVSPEAQYSFEQVIEEEGSSSPDLTGVMRWGVSYSDKFFQAGFSSALYPPSLQGSSMLMQTCGEVTLYMPQSPLYINAHAVYQEVKDGSEHLSLGLGIGFVL